MTGWVSPSYGFGNPTLNLSSLTERQYRGFKRDVELMNEIRSQFIDKKDQIISVVNSLKNRFSNELREVAIAIISKYTSINMSTKILQPDVTPQYYNQILFENVTNQQTHLAFFPSK